jgi:hypothetical protein
VGLDVVRHFLEPKKLFFDAGRWAQFIRKMSSLLLLKPLIANGKI